MTPSSATLSLLLLTELARAQIAIDASRLSDQPVLEPGPP